MTAPTIDGVRLMARLAELRAISSGAGSGVTRLGWSAEERQAVALVARWAEAAGARVWVDPAGSLIAELAGAHRDAEPLVTGSHLDTVVDAGHLDGAYGVVAGIEVLVALASAGVTLGRPLRVVAYVNEEGVVAPPYTGSRAIAGAFDSAELLALGPDGVTLAERLAGVGLDADAVEDAAWTSPVAAVFELHIEQGPILEQTGTAVGVVTAITGQQRGTIVVTGETNHAGTTPMAQRRDALAAAARVVLAVEAIARSGPADVATVGRLEVSPGVGNVIAGAVSLSYDLRSVDEERCQAAAATLRSRLEEIAAETGTLLSMHPGPPAPAVPTDPRLRALITEACHSRALSSREMGSGAGHDTAYMARLGPAAMIFVPSARGISHSPGEDTADKFLVMGAQVLCDVIVLADAAL
jgi:hydantoinase/carbamoylase family amidase